MTPIPMVSATPVRAVPSQGMQANAGDGDQDFFEALLAFFGEVQSAPPAAVPATGEQAPADEGQSEVGGDPEDEDGAKGDRLANPLLGPAMDTPAIAVATDTTPPIPVPDAETAEPDKDGGAAPADPSVSTAAIAPAASTADRRVGLVPAEEAQAPPEHAPPFSAVTSSPGASPRRDSESTGHPPREAAPSADDGRSRDTARPVATVSTPTERAAITPDTSSPAPPEAASGVLVNADETLRGGVTRTIVNDGDKVEPGHGKHPPAEAFGAAREAKGPGPSPDGTPPASGAEGRSGNEARTSLADAAPPAERGRGRVESGDRPGGDMSRALPSPPAVVGNPSHAAPIHPPLVPTAPREIAPPVIVTTPVAADRLPEVLAAEMVRTTPSGEHRLEITLHPPELGRVEVSMVVSREAIHARLVAHTEGARDLLSHHLAGLRQQLVAQGFADPQLSVDLRHGSGERHWQRPNDGAPAASRPETGQPVTPNTAPTRHRGDRQFFHRVA